MTCGPAIEDGHLTINDERILRECRSFTNTDADDLGRSRVRHFTNHFDLLMAAAIAWEMRKHAKTKAVTTDYEQAPYERTGFNSRVGELPQVWVVLQASQGGRVSQVPPSWRIHVGYQQPPYEGPNLTA
jgi:hypothetical protein